MSHTSGPWELILGRYLPDHPVWGFGIKAEGKIPFVASAGMSPPENHVTVIADEHLHFVTTGFSAAECEANARLIAAAPDLLDACIRAKKALDGLGLDWLGKDPDPLEAAINKATKPA